MARERLKSPRARLFVALDLPERVRERIGAWQRAECSDPALRPVSAQALHITFCFLGYRPEREVGRIGEILGDTVQGPVPLRFAQEPVPVPRSRPRLFAIGAESRASVALQAKLAGALEAERLHRREKRDFWPHVTVARVRPERRREGPSRRRGGRPQAVETAPGPIPEALCEAFDAVRVALYRSILRPQGAEYVPLVALDLPPTESASSAAAGEEVAGSAEASEGRGDEEDD